MHVFGLVALQTQIQIQCLLLGWLLWKGETFLLKKGCPRPHCTPVTVYLSLSLSSPCSSLCFYQCNWILSPNWFRNINVGWTLLPQHLNKDEPNQACALIFGRSVMTHYSKVYCECFKAVCRRSQTFFPVIYHILSTFFQIGVFAFVYVCILMQIIDRKITYNAASPRNLHCIVCCCAFTARWPTFFVFSGFCAASFSILHTYIHTHVHAHTFTMITDV